MRPGSARRVDWEKLSTLERYQTFTDLAKKLLAVAAARTGNERSAAKNPQVEPLVLVLGNLLFWLLLLMLVLFLLLEPGGPTASRTDTNFGPQGNPKTPGLVDAVLRDALKGLDQVEEPEEGST